VSRPLRLKLLGHPALFDERSNERIPVPEKAFLLATKLVLSESSAISRQEAANFLYEDSPSPKGALRVMLSRVRSQEEAMGFRLFVADNEQVRLSGQIETDLQKLLDAPRLRSGANFEAPAFKELLTGIAESGADLSCWLRDQRFEMRSRVIRALCIFLDHAPKNETGVDIERLALRLIEIDPYAEAGYRALMRIRSSEGGPADASAIYRQLCARLSADLQTTPSAETADLCREIAGLVPSPHLANAAPDRSDLRKHPASVHVLPPPDSGCEQYPLTRPLVEEVIFSLCRLSTLSVMAPHTVERWRRTAGPLKLDYVVESAFASDGLVWKLIELRSGRIVWADRVHLGTTLLPEGLQGAATQIANRVAETIDKLALGSGWSNRDPAADSLFALGEQELKSIRLQDIRKARGLFRQSLALVPDFAPALGRIAQTYQLEWLLLGRGDPDLLHQAERFARRALSDDPREISGLRELGVCYLYQGRHDDALELLAEAERRAPHHADLLADHADVLALSGSPQDGLSRLDRAIQLNPAVPDSYWWNQATIFFQLERYSEAIDAVMRMGEIAPALRLLAASHAMSGNDAEARRLAQKVRSIYPDFRAAKWVSSLPIRDPIIRSAYENGLRKSGLH
jgi:DNA-binding SARP family transcriptional activator